MSARCLVCDDERCRHCGELVAVAHPSGACGGCIQDAAEAVDIFGDDELEHYAAERAAERRRAGR